MFGFFDEFFALELKRRFGNIRRLIGYSFKVGYHFKRGGNFSEIARHGVFHKQNFQTILLDFALRVIDVFILAHNFFCKVFVAMFKRVYRFLYRKFNRMAHIDEFGENVRKLALVFASYAHSIPLFAPFFK